MHSLGEARVEYLRSLLQSELSGRAEGWSVEAIVSAWDLQFKCTHSSGYEVYSPSIHYRDVSFIDGWVICYAELFEILREGSNQKVNTKVGGRALWVITAALWFLLWGILSLTNIQFVGSQIILGVLAILTAIFLFLAA